ncbi:MAG: ATP-binding cassette domain-containing protein [Pseudomonadota bacterium]
MTDTPVLQLDGVSKYFDQRLVVDGVSLSIGHGEHVAVLGARGAGRSTLAGIVTGRLTPNTGRVHRFGSVGPPIGKPAGIGTTGRLERDLAMRAALWGIDKGTLTDAVFRALGRLSAAGLADVRAEDVLTRRADRLPEVVRQTVLHAAAWAVPAPLYVVDGPIRPNDRRAARAVAPWIQAAIATSALLWFPPKGSALRHTQVSRALTLRNGRLHGSIAAS